MVLVIVPEKVVEDPVVASDDPELAFWLKSKG